MHISPPKSCPADGGADLQKKPKEASNKIHAEKNIIQNNVDSMMKDSRKLKLELHKICRDEADNGAQKKD